MNKSVKRRNRSKKLRRSKKINKHSNKTKRRTISKRQRKRRRRKINSSKVKKGGFNHFYVPPFNLNGLKIGNDTITSPLKLNETVAKFMDKKCI